VRLSDNRARIGNPARAMRARHAFKYLSVDGGVRLHGDAASR